MGVISSPRQRNVAVGLGGCGTVLMRVRLGLELLTLLTGGRAADGAGPGPVPRGEV